MIRRFCKGIFTDEYKKTIGVDFLEKALFVDALGEEVRFMLWDTAGQEEFDSITRTYYRGAGAAVIAFSTTDRASFDAVAGWKAKIEAECGDIAMAIVQNKRIGESKWRPLELCFWPEQGALPAKGKEYPGLGYKRLRDKPPKAQEQQEQPAEAQ
ncbi:uncharacterized protein HaLaN_07174 [Haematococcus lacustris]|uniref:Ras-related protein Rab-23 n=1 Tax=Haematococcus lacustris TaxID=44745 RepID=A0A699Z7Z0_HAELA|nr:uncharacterized protein HaLaN_07174 [Haematococcus lacustris]